VNGAPVHGAPGLGLGLGLGLVPMPVPGALALERRALARQVLERQG
jgi:hypothetical protein